MIVRVVDTETTGVSYPDDKIVEIASYDYSPGLNAFNSPREELVHPQRDIPAESRAVHHLSIEDLSQARTLDLVIPDVLLQGMAPYAFAAHRADFEMQWLKEFTGDAPWICTYKVALRLWPEAPKHSNQVLRYWLDLPIPAEYAKQPPHRALPDCVVTAYLLAHECLHYKVRREDIIDTQDVLDQFIKWSSEPALLPRIGFGQHIGKPWSEVPGDYLEWMIEKSDRSADEKWNALHELGRRDKLRLEAGVEHYLNSCIGVIAEFANVAQMEDWFLDQRANRAALDIVNGTLAYKQIVTMCSKRKQELNRAA